MPSLPELGASLNIPVSEVIRMGETQATNAESTVFKAIESAMMQKLAAMKVANETEAKKKGGKSRVYIQHAVPTQYRFSLVSAFPMYDIRFSSNDIRSGAVSIAVSALIAEYMLNKFKVSQGKVVAYGIGVKQVVMRNRSWVHLCVPGHLSRAQVEFLRDDRAIAAMTHSMRSTKENILCKSYVAGQANVHCTESSRCEVKAKVGMMLLNKTDTNLRQIALHMRQHDMRLLYFAVPGSKEMEMCMEGNLPDLDAHVFPSDGGERINISYKNAPAEDMAYTYANYLELVARTSVVIAGETYHKEFDNKIHGYLVYKVTRLIGTFADPPPPYKSWVEPNYASKYLVYIPTLRDGGSVGDATHWSLTGVPIDRAIVDDVVDYAMRAQGVPDISQRIEKRLFTRTSNYSLVNQVVQVEGEVPAHLFDSLCLALYCSVFMRKFHDGKTVSTLAPHARQMARLAQAGTGGVVVAYVGMLLGNLVRATGIVTDKVRSVYYDAMTDGALPMPTFSVCPGFVEYSDNGSSNPRFMGWYSGDFSDTVGFSTALTGTIQSSRLKHIASTSVVSHQTSVDPGLIDAVIATGEAFVSDDATLQASEHAPIRDIVFGFVESVAAVFQGVPDACVDAVDSYDQTPMRVPDHRSEVAVRKGPMFAVVKQKPHATSSTTGVRDLVQRILNDNKNMANVRREGYTEVKAVFAPGIPEIVPGYVATDPIQYMMDGLMTIFPNSLTMNTEHFETDRNYSSWDVLTKAIKVKFDISKLEAGRPESVFAPVLRGHVVPNVKDTFSTTLHSVKKRNLDTPAAQDPMDMDFLWDRARKAMYKVFYVDGAEEKLAKMPYIGPSERDVTEWASRLDEKKRERLLAQPEGYTFAEMFNATTDTQLMVKKKLKPTMDASYDTAVKYPQTIQYDATGKSVAVFSPIIAQKVKREQEILKPNVLVLQGKSVDDIDKFLNGFDWRPNELGKRFYIEIDYTMYDKSQGKRLAESYLKQLSEFGALPEFVRFIRDSQHVRTVAAMKAGIKAWLRDQNESGAAFTLDRNNAINMTVIAELLLEIIRQIEFIILMGDDIIIAVRGHVDISHWETELSRKYNLTLKAQVHEHGYICSLDIAHLPGGHTRAVRDPLKAALMYMDMSMSDEEKFVERFVSYCDSTNGLQDLHTQVYLAAAKSVRMQQYLPTTTVDSVMCLLMAHAGFRNSYESFRSAFSPVRRLRTV